MCVLERETESERDREEGREIVWEEGHQAKGTDQLCQLDSSYSDYSYQNDLDYFCACDDVQPDKRFWVVLEPTSLCVGGKGREVNERGWGKGKEVKEKDRDEDGV